MAIVVGTSSWATVAEADAYLTDRINADEWFALPDPPANPGEVSKDSLLISAFRWLMSAPQLSLSASLSSDDIKNAQIEAAWFLYEHHSALNERRAAIFTGVEEFGLSRRKEKLNITNLRIPDFIIGSLGAYNTENVTVTLLGEYDI